MELQQIADQLERLYRMPDDHGGGREILLDAARELREMEKLDEELTTMNSIYDSLMVSHAKLEAAVAGLGKLLRSD